MTQSTTLFDVYFEVLILKLQAGFCMTANCPDTIPEFRKLGIVMSIRAYRFRKLEIVMPIRAYRLLFLLTKINNIERIHIYSYIGGQFMKKIMNDFKFRYR